MVRGVGEQGGQGGAGGAPKVVGAAVLLVTASR